MNLRTRLALAALGVVLASNQAMAAVDSTAFVSMRSDALSMVSYALAAISLVIVAVLGIKGLVFAYNQIKARLGR